MPEFLLEILTEDMPPEHQKEGKKQLKDKFEKFLKDKRIEYDTIDVFSTKTRLTVFIGNLEEKQKPREDLIIGPPKKVAFDEEGNPTKAAEGFLKSKGKTIEDIEIIDTGKGEYIGIKIVDEGKSTKEILEDELKSIIKSLSFPKTMYWEREKVEFSRPIRGLLVLFSGKTVEVEIAGIKSSNKTKGHLVLMKGKEIEVENFKDYKEKLKENCIIIDEKEREEIIKDKIGEIEKELGLNVVLDKELFEELLYISEYPQLFYGKFDEKFLQLPEEIVSMFLKSEKKLFTTKKDSVLTNYFVGVGDFLIEAKENVEEGFERVVSATLEDALFFYKNDLELDFEELYERLDEFLFMEGLGTYRERTERIEDLVEYILEKIEKEEYKPYLKKAARYSKVDQLTQMVFEFTSLQGVAGGIYLREKGEDERVWKAVYEHYKPESIEDKIPESLTGKILSIADKIDLLTAAFILKGDISGTKDPLGARRAGNGIVKTLIEGEISLSVNELIKKSIELLDGNMEIEGKIHDFIYNRFRYYEEEVNGIEYDILNSLKSTFSDPYREHLKAISIKKAKSNKNFEKLIIAYKRAKNIIKGFEREEIKEELFKEKEEEQLFSFIKAIETEFQKHVDSFEFLKAQELLLTLKPFIDSFFDNVLVMTDDEELKQNRIALLQHTVELFETIADYSEIIVEGE